MGESKRWPMAALAGVEDGGDQPQVVDTLGGRMHVRWDEGAAATPHGQLVFFAEFLAATGVFERWVSQCPLEYRSGNAPDKRDVLGTLMMGMLAGQRRYAHITALRGDAVAAQALGMNKVVSEDALRRALERIDEAASTAWMRPALQRAQHRVSELLRISALQLFEQRHRHQRGCRFEHRHYLRVPHLGQRISPRSPMACGPLRWKLRRRLDSAGAGHADARLGSCSLLAVLAPQCLVFVHL
jgi:hypothetical protein